MTESIAEVTELPTGHPAGCPFDPPRELSEIRESAPLVRMAFPDGHRGWLATGHEAVRAVLSDKRFSSRYELLHLPFPDMGMAEMPPASPGDFTGIDPPGHTRYRSLLTSKFTVRRMRLLTDRVEELVTEHLDEMERTGPPVDLMPAFARPIPTLMICELLGVPADKADVFQRFAEVTNEYDATAEDHAEAIGALTAYLSELIPAKRANPTDDLLSDLLSDQTANDLTDEEVGGLCGILLGAGVDTTGNMLALGTFALLRHPEQLAALTAEPELIGNAVEELMRYLSIIHTTARAALDDVEIGGQLIKKGETVVVSTIGANRDPARFADPDTLDLRRKTAGQVGFGHGIHQCLGQQLARVEMTVAFPLLFKRFPTLRLAVPDDEVPLRDAMILGVRSLPVTWDTP
ncbi:cytochrome P450 [Herbihabitans rhizosphaerae]|uniref:Cytochrome P450 n=1 Tax=Herbihabitans rhizosphaerae TaxID=1872711 RepID=A0A4Q7KLA5_9PSEU|nr:cytochrome P450 [Herbihabitans rhizosphaerae]RZS37026.1 cytochrome P450 [Herbihabitans rhizosphaerae]